MKYIHTVTLVTYNRGEIRNTYTILHIVCITHLYLPSGIKLGHGPSALYTNGHRSCKENSMKLYT